MHFSRRKADSLVEIKAGCIVPCSMYPRVHVWPGMIPGRTKWRFFETRSEASRHVRPVAVRVREIGGVTFPQIQTAIKPKGGKEIRPK